MPAPGPPNGGGPNLPTDLDLALSDTNSVATGSNVTIQEHEYERYYTPRHGRRFHTFPGSQYFLPADEEESRRLREQHQIFQSLLGGDYYQLLGEMLGTGGNGDIVVLDLGCGPGTWVEEFAEEFQFAEFIGVDLVPMARQQLENAQFECYDISARGIGERNGDVGVVHARCLSFGDFGRLLQDAHSVLTPGGLLISIEIDWRLDHQSEFPHFNMQATQDFLGRVATCAAVANAGVAWDPALIPGWLVDAGFQNVQREVREIPVGPWMGSQPMQELGRLVQTMYIKFVAAMRSALLRLPGADVAQVNDLVAEVMHELESEENDGWSIPVYLVTAYKG
ncbi:hypothetical protein M407DRAFT_22994 [Tulasnella calospora MUT 4182]|uniref:Methyltransferase domain-containing protein n=1 Tax=Tulasnella calospora MUT 4182 TaxID=1051891 RepID=A0A0C3M2B9_9AGAM|nr:hypothetical protein M407DRAFT_22994 [Tulasnella calospora MUT 4182]